MSESDRSRRRAWMTGSGEFIRGQRPAPAPGVPAIVPSRVDVGPAEHTFTALDVLAYATTHYSGATVARIEFLTNGTLRTRRGHGEHLPDDTPLCLLTLHGAFVHGLPPFIRRLQIAVPIKDRLVLTFHGVTGNLLSEGFGYQRESE